jgi:exosortase A
MTPFEPDFPRPSVLPPERLRLWHIAAAAIGMACVVLIAGFWDLAEGAVRVWYHSATYTHGFLIIPISAYLIYERRAVFAALAPQPFLPVLVLLPLGGAVWLVPRIAGVLEAQQFVFIGMLQVVFLAVLGWRAYWALLFPCLYLFFLVPSGEYLVPTLQDFTGAFAVKGLELVGIPVHADGTIIEIPNGTFRVDEACAGLRFLIASIAFGFLFANLTYRSLAKQAVFVVLSIGVPIIANGLRAFGIIILAHLTDNKLAAGADHIVYGWGFFVAVTLFLIWVGLKFRDPAPISAPTPDTAAPAKPVRIAFAAALAVVLALAAPAYAAYLQSRPAPAAPTALVIPDSIGGWTRAPSASGWKPSFASADVELAVTYTKDGKQVDLYIAYYTHQQKGHELITYDNQIADGTLWRRIGGGQAIVNFEGRPLPVAVTRLWATTRQRLAWHWYWIDGEFTASTLRAKLLQVRAELVTRRRPAAAIVVSVDQTLGVEDAAETLRDFTQNLGPLRATLTP